MQSPYRKAPDSWQIQTEDLPFCEATVPTEVVYHCTVPPNHIVLMVQKTKKATSSKHGSAHQQSITTKSKNGLYVQVLQPHDH